MSEGTTKFEERHARKLYETLARIIGEKENVNITVTVKRKDSLDPKKA